MWLIVKSNEDRSTKQKTLNTRTTLETIMIKTEKCSTVQWYCCDYQRKQQKLPNACIPSITDCPTLISSFSPLSLTIATVSISAISNRLRVYALIQHILSHCCAVLTAKSKLNTYNIKGQKHFQTVAAWWELMHINEWHSRKKNTVLSYA